jgi:hypothetical protein
MQNNNLTPDQHVWLSAWCAVASAVGCATPETAKNWADNCLHDFQQKFSKEVTPRQQLEPSELLRPELD